MYLVVPNEFLKTTTESSSLVIQLPSALEEGVMAHCCGIPECWLNWQRLVQWQKQYNPWKREEYGYKTVSQSCVVAKHEYFWRATGRSNWAYKLLAATKLFQSLVFVLSVSQSFIVLSSLIDQWPAIIFHF